MDGNDGDGMTFDDFLRWKVTELRNYLVDRGIARARKNKAELEHWPMQRTWVRPRY